MHKALSADEFMRLDAALTNRFVSEFENLWQSQNLKIDNEKMQNAQRKTREHYKNHAKRFRVKINSIEPAKHIAWLVFFYIKELKNCDRDLIFKLLDCAFFVMSILPRVNCHFDKEIRQKILLMCFVQLQSDKMRENSQNLQNDDCIFGIGMNGLYMLFKTNAKSL